MEKKCHLKPTSSLTEVSELIFRLEKYNYDKMFSLCKFVSNKIRESAQNPPAQYNNELK